MRRADLVVVGATYVLNSYRMTSPAIDHRVGVTGNPETCSCILREAWPGRGSWPKGQTLTYGKGEFFSVTTVLAVRRGHFGCLKYAVENGCPLDKAIYREDVRTPQQFQCIEYVLQLGLPIDVEDFIGACTDCNSAYLKTLIEAQRRGHTFSDGGEIISHSPFDDGCIQNVVQNAHRFDAQEAIGSLANELSELKKSLENDVIAKAEEREANTVTVGDIANMTWEEAHNEFSRLKGGN